jgi:A/G-specific adenine glycosylase
MSNFPGRVLRWYEQHGRKHLPWQRRDAYCVWVSEIMLQQTQVQTVIPYFERFMRSFPSVVALADADIDTVLDHWSGLGYYARARNLHSAARTVRDQHDGDFPKRFDDVVALPGIGRSTAGAIMALAYGERYPILDGNVKRVLARHGAIAGWPGKTDVAETLWRAAEEYLPQSGVREYTQAMMDLGATVCTRSRPQCDACPVHANCAARAAGTIDQYPGRKAKKTKPLKETTMVLAVSGGFIYLERRPPAGIWGGLWSLPELSNGQVGDWCRATLDSAGQSMESWDTLRHSFSHYDLDIQPVVVRIEATSRKVADSDDVTWHSLDAAPPGGIAAPVQKLINTLKDETHAQKN